MRLFPLLIGLAILLTACGTKGPLVMPKPAAAKTAPVDDSNKAKAEAAQ